MIVHRLEQNIAARMNRSYARLVGRGTTALYVALRALTELMPSPPTPLLKARAVILPDLICATVLDGALLAGWTPLFADVIPARFTLDPVSVRQRLAQPGTAPAGAVLNAHLYGHVSEVGDFGVPLIEDAIQGLGGAVGTQGDITLISFDDHKMISGRGGALLTDHPAIWDAIQHVSLDASNLPIPPSDEAARFRAYRHQVFAKELIRPFDASEDNLTRIAAGWAALAENVRARNEKAARLHGLLADLPLDLPEIRAGDAIWRYTFAVPSVACASWIVRHLQQAGLRGSSLYPPLSTLFAPDPLLFSATLARRMVNLWVDAATCDTELDRTAQIVRQGVERMCGG